MNEREQTRRRTPLRRMTALVLSWVLSSMAFVGEVAALAPTAAAELSPVSAAPAEPSRASAAPAAQTPARAANPRSPRAPRANAPVVTLEGGGVEPILECVVTDPESGDHTAYYGYHNHEDHAVTIPVGADNFFWDGAPNRGQPTVFQPGRTAPYPDALFSVPYPGGDKLHWTLQSPEGSYTVTASGGPECPTDTDPPYLAITPVNASIVSGPTPLFRAEYSDDWLDLPTFSAQVDGVDRTAMFAVYSVKATWTPSAADALGDGPHTFMVSIGDTFGNVAQASSTFTVDTSAPVVVIETPPGGSYHNTTPTLTGTVQDHDPAGTTVQCISRVDTIPASVSWSGTTGTFSCELPLAEGPNDVVVAATDGKGRMGEATRQLHFDTEVPMVWISKPSDQSYTAATSLMVRGGFLDASPIASVRVEGVTATVIGNKFIAEGVPVGAGPIVTFTAEAEDVAGNVGTSSPPTTINVDRIPPVVTIDTPTNGAIVPGRDVLVTGTVTETSPFIVDVNGELATVTGQSFSVTVPASMAGPLKLTATARDAAGQTDQKFVTVTVDRTDPELTVTSPPPGAEFVTRETSVMVTGTVSDNTAVTLTVDENGTPVPVPVVAGAFSYEKNLPEETTYAIRFVATDEAGREAEETVTVRVDRTPPQVTVRTPTKTVTELPIAVAGTVGDTSTVDITVEGAEATVTGDAWEASVPFVGEGNQVLHVVATDAAGNEVELDYPIVVDLANPVVTISEPAHGAITSAAFVTVKGTVAENEVARVVVGSVVATVTPAGTGLWHFTAPNVPLVEGANLLVATATDSTGQTGEATVEVTRDLVPPHVTLSAPESAAPGATVAVEAFPTDTSGIDRVDFFLSDVLVASREAAPYSAPVTIPAGTESGTTLVVKATAVDLAGNEADASRGIQVVNSGIVAGQVLSDATSLPIEGAVVRLLSGEPFETVTDARGRYAVPVQAAQALLSASRDGHITVERAASIANAAGTIPVDARLTPLAAPVVVGPGGGELEVEVTRPSSSGPVTMHATVAVPPGAVSADADFRLTALSAQGLPNLLPLGWAPVLAVDVRASAEVTGQLEASLTGLPEGTLHLASYSTTMHGWLMVAPALEPAGGALSLTLPSTGAYALVRADEVEPPLALPAPGEPLPSAAFVAIPEGAASTSTVTPAVLPPTGGTARGALTVTSPVALPSGTVVQAEVTETFTLVSGPVVSEEVRTQDLLLARDAGAPEAALRAEVPITAARTFGPTDLVEGRVHLDILAGREGIRGSTGGDQPVTVTDGDATLRVPAGALPEDTVVSLDKVPLSPFLPQVAGVTAIAEVLVGLEGRTLELAAELSVSGAGVPAGETLWLARIERPGGVPFPMVVARASLESGRVVTVAHSGLPGLRAEGRYVFFRVGRPVGLVGGVTSTAVGPIGALVQTATLPFVGISGSDGAYVVLAEAGTVDLSARALVTAHAGSDMAELPEGALVVADILLAGIQTVATVTPADQAISVPTGARVEIRASAAMALASVTHTTVRLIGPAAPVPLRLELSASGKLLLAIPLEPLLPDTEYMLVVAGLLDLAGGPVDVPATSFRTKDDSPPVYDTDRIVFSFPDANGDVQVKVEPGSMLPVGSEILIINSGNGVVVTFTFIEVGAPVAKFPATLNDQLLVTVTDPFGNVTTFQRSQYEDSNGTTAVGAGGGTVKTDGNELRLPAGATAQAVRLKLTAFDENSPLPKPSLGTDGNGNPLAHFGAGLTVESPDKPTFAKEVDIAFPLPEGLPENPSDAVFYVFRRLTGPNGEVLNEVIDQAKVEGAGAERKVVTASFPFLGFIATQGLVTNHFFLMYTYNSSLPGVPLPGAITGKVLRAVWPEGASQPEFVPVTSGTARVRVTNPGPGQEGLVAAVHPTTGTFTLWDTAYTGGNIDVVATVTNAAGQVETATGTAVEANPANWATTGLQFYQNIATVNLTFPLESSGGPPPTLQVGLVNADSGVQVTGGIVPEGTRLKAVLTATNATLGAALLQGLPCTVTHPDPTDLSRGEVDLTPGSACPIAAPGAYTLIASANPAQGAPVTASRSLLVVVSGGGNTEIIEGVAPTVVDVHPAEGATGASVTTLPQVVFSEPVTGIGPGIVSLREMVDGVPGPEVALTVLAVLRNGTVVENPTVDAQVVTLTARPLVSLRYGTSYRLALGSGIADLDVEPGPRALVPPSEWTFRTFAPTGVGGSEEDFGSAGITLIDDRAFLAEINLGSSGAGHQGHVRAFDLSDPQTPVEIDSARADLQQRPVDLWAREGGNTDRDELAVGVTITAASKPSNLHLFDVQDRETTRWVGVTSVSNSTLDGILQRVVFQGRYVYVLTHRKGIQVVDTQEAKALFLAQTGGATDTPGYFEMLQKMNTEGQGFGQTAVVATIPYRYDQNVQWNLWDLDVASLTVGGLAQPITFSVGEQRLANNWYMVSANPQTLQSVAETPLTGPGGVLFRGRQMALGRLQNQDLAVVVGSGSFGPSGEDALGLRIFDVTNPAVPLPKGFLVFTDLEGFSGDVTDVQIKGDKALVAGTEGVVVVSIADPTQPQVIGVVEGAGGRLAVGQGDLDGLLFSTGRSVVGGSNPLGGVNVAAFDLMGLVLRPRPALSRPVPPPTGEPVEEETVADIPISVRVYPTDADVAMARLQLFENGLAIGSPIDIALAAGAGSFNLARGFRRRIDSITTAIMSFFRPDGAPVNSPVRKINIGRVVLRVDSNNDTIVAGEGTPKDDEDGAAEAQGKAFAFWEGDPNADEEEALVDYATASVRLKTQIDPDQRLALRLSDSSWELHRKADLRDLAGALPADLTQCSNENKLYLCHAGVMGRQLSLNRATDPALAPTPRGGGVIEIPYSLLGEQSRNDFLFRCTTESGGATPCQASELEVGQLQPNGLFERLGSVKITIKKLKSLTSMLTLRGDTTYSSQWEDPHYHVAPDAAEVDGWESLESKLSSAKNVTVIVHGYAVGQQEFLEGTSDSLSEFQLLAKRLYWAKHPILQAQDDARVVGVSWPGDIPGGIHPFWQAVLSTDEVRPYFAEDEFNALLAGIPLAKKLTELRTGPPGRKISILAHSLGNMVVNSALKRMIEAGSTGAPINYAMLQAAISSDAFLQDYDPLIAAQTVPGLDKMLAQAQRIGFPDPNAGQPLPDGNWRQHEQDIYEELNEYPGEYACPRTPPFHVYVNPDCFDPEVGPTLPAWQCRSYRCDDSTKFFKGFAAVDTGLSPVATNFTSPPTLPTYFNTRWGKLQLNQNFTVPGPWTRFFVASVTSPPPGIRVYNAYNPGDYVLRIDRDYHERLSVLETILYGPLGPFIAEFRSSRLHAWKALQMLGKPFASPTGIEPVENRILDILRLGGARDPLSAQKWWTLEIEGRPSPWQSTSQVPAWVVEVAGEGAQAWLRRGAELAMWYPALAAPAGVGPLAPLNGHPIVGGLEGLEAVGSNIDMSRIGGEEGPNSIGTPSHSYMGMKKFHQTWHGFRAFRTVFEQ